MLVNDKCFLEVADVVAEQALIEVLLDECLEGFYVVRVPEKGNEEVADLILVVCTQTHKGKGFLDQIIDIHLLTPVAFAALDETAQALHFFIERRQSDLLRAVVQQQPDNVDDIGVD